MVYTKSMQEMPTANLFENINFPRQISLIKTLRYVSFAVNDFILFLGFFIGFVWIFRIPGAYEKLFHKLHIYPFSSVLFLLSGAVLLFGAKRHLISSHKDAEKDESPWWNTWIPITLAAITAVFGFINLAQLSHAGLLSFFRISPFGGLCFFLTGLALIPPYTRILHRFHITQLFMFIISGLGIFVIWENVYQMFSPLPMQHIISIPLPTAFTLTLFSFGILIRWSNRGFLGNFTLDSTSSIFAFRLFLIQLISAPLIAFFVLALLQHTSYNMYQILTVIVVLSLFISSTLLWFNVKLLYRYDLEHLLMRESLKSHNIDLTTEKEDLRKKMIQLEQEKQQYADKLNTQVVWQDMADTLR